MGNLTRDPEVRTLPSGTRVAKMGLAVSETWRDKTTGETREITCFVDVEVWDKLAELCAQYLSKGAPALVEGRLRMDEWTNKEGEKRSKLLVRADTVRFLRAASRPGTADASDTQRGAAPAAGTPQPASSTSVPPAFAEETDDTENLPF